MDNNADFSSPEVDELLAVPLFAPDTPPADDTYYWRAKAFTVSGEESPFSPAVQVTIVTAEPLELPSPPIEGPGAFPVTTTSLMSNGFWQVDYLNTLAPFLQRKDTNLLCWQGDAETGTRRPWDGPHADTPGNHSTHGRNYCARAAISMINHYYGGDLSQDRITYEHFKIFGGKALALGHDQRLAIVAGQNLLS